MYSEFEYRTVVNDVITSDTLYLYHSDNPFSPIVLATTTQDEALLPGPVIPDGQGGVLATWTISPSHSVLQFPYQAADVANGTVGSRTAYPSARRVSRPFSSRQRLCSAKMELRSRAPRQRHPTECTQVSQVASFSVSSGAPNWTIKRRQGTHYLC